MGPRQSQATHPTPRLPYQAWFIKRQSSVAEARNQDCNMGNGREEALTSTRGWTEAILITYSDVIWATSWREVKPAVRKLSLY